MGKASEVSNKKGKKRWFNQERWLFNHRSKEIVGIWVMGSTTNKDRAPCSLEGHHHSSMANFKDGVRWTKGWKETVVGYEAIWYGFLRCWESICYKPLRHAGYEFQCWCIRCVLPSDKLFATLPLYVSRLDMGCFAISGAKYVNCPPIIWKSPFIEDVVSGYKPPFIVDFQLPCLIRRGCSNIL